jgi:hypothetical protein
MAVPSWAAIESIAVKTCRTPEYVSTWQGFVYVAFVIDVFARRIVGWRVHSERLAEAGIEPSVGSKEDSYDTQSMMSLNACRI